MTSGSTTIRVNHDQRSRLRSLAAQRSASMTETLDAALNALQRDEFYKAMSESERHLRGDLDAWPDFAKDRDEWLNAKLS